MKRALAAAALAIALGAACSPLGNASASPSATATGSPLAKASGSLAAQAPMPPGFPSDVPIYTGARLTAGASFVASGVTTWGMEWETLDSVDKVHAFYAKELAKGDWTITFVATSGSAFAAQFARRSNAHYGGTLGAENSAGVTRISMYLASQA